jgi:hypothetical protein
MRVERRYIEYGLPNGVIGEGSYDRTFLSDKSKKE